MIENEFLQQPAQAVVRVNRQADYADFVDARFEAVNQDREALMAELLSARDDARLAWVTAVICFLTLALGMARGLFLGAGL